MKRYALFTGMVYYPSRGWHDFKGTFDRVEDALNQPREDWWQVIDLQTGELIYEGEN